MQEYNLYANEIKCEKDNIHEDKKHDCFGKAIQIGASFVNEYIHKNATTNKYNSHIAEHKLKVIGKKPSTRGKKETTVDDYFKDEPYPKSTLLTKEKYILSHAYIVHQLSTASFSNFKLL